MPRGSIEAELGDVKEICVGGYGLVRPPARTVGSPGAATVSCNRRACGRQRAPKGGYVMWVMNDRGTSGQMRHRDVHKKL